MSSGPGTCVQPQRCDTRGSEEIDPEISPTSDIDRETTKSITAQHVMAPYAAHNLASLQLL